MAKITQIC